MKERRRAGGTSPDANDKTAMAVSADALARWVSGPEAHEDSPRARRLLRLVESHPPDAAEGNDTDALAARLFGPSQLVLYRGASWRLCSNGSLRRWDVAGQRWESIRPDHWSMDEATFADESPVVDALRSAPNADTQMLEGCTCLGGTLGTLCIYGKYTIVFARESVTMLSHQAGIIEISRDDVVDIELGGKGRVGRTPGEVDTFAFQSEVSAADMAATAVVRSLVARARMDTSLRIETRRGEAFFHCDCATPDELRRSLASFLTGLRRSTTNETSPRLDVASQLVELADLRTRGLLTDDEFASAKAAVLGLPS